MEVSAFPESFCAAHDVRLNFAQAARVQLIKIDDDSPLFQDKLSYGSSFFKTIAIFRQ